MKEELTLEQKATNNDTWRHINRVQQLVLGCVKNLTDRAVVHDQSKLSHPEVSLFTEYTPKLAGTTYGSPEYDEYRKALGPALTHHYANNRHHPEFHEQSEKWLDIKGYEPWYEVSDRGRVRTKKTGLIRKPQLTPKGYLRLQLGVSGKPINAFIHRLVANAFIDFEGDSKQINHKNGVKTDNRVSNLEWVSPSENLQHAYDTGLRSSAVKYVVTCSELDVTTYGCEKMETLLKEKGYNKASASSIWRCITDNKGTHLGFTFTSENIADVPEVNGIEDMTLLDLVEMLCDWKAASERHDDGNIRKSIEVNAERFNMTPQLRRIFENTINEIV